MKFEFSRLKWSSPNIFGLNSNMSQSIFSENEFFGTKMILFIDFVIACFNQNLDRILSGNRPRVDRPPAARLGCCNSEAISLAMALI